MSEQHFSFEPTGAGWATCSYRVGDTSVDSRPSALGDAPGDFLGAVTAMCCGAHVAWASWELEPECDRWLFIDYEADRLSVRVIRANNADPWLTSEARTRFREVVSFRGFCEEVLRAFSQLVATHTDDTYAEAWVPEGLADLRESVETLRLAMAQGPTAAVLARLPSPPPPELGGWDSDPKIAASRS